MNNPDYLMAVDVFFYGFIIHRYVARMARTSIFADKIRVFYSHSKWSSQIVACIARVYDMYLITEVILKYSPSQLTEQYLKQFKLV